MKLLPHTNITQLTTSHIRGHILQSPIIVYKANMTHVDAVPLHHRHPPPSLSNHTQLDDNDRDIWDRAYANEYLDLVEDTVPWVYITGEEY